MSYAKTTDNRGTAAFIQERRYLQNVTTKTVDWYGHSFKAFDGCLESLESAKTRIVELRQRGVSAISVNTYLRCINAFWRRQWLKTSDEPNAPKKPWKIGRLKEEQKILATLTTEQLHRILSWKATSGTNLRRAHLAALTILDTGLRASEVLSLTIGDVDCDNLVIKTKGKGSKYRLVPFSAELRKSVFRLIMQRKEMFVDSTYLFGTKNNTKLTVRNFERDLKVLGEKCGITGVRFSPHTLRHTMAVFYLRRGEDIYSLSRILGHSSVSITEVYLRSINIDDLKRNLNRLSVSGGAL